jgi:hypothetical protein
VSVQVNAFPPQPNVPLFSVEVKGETADKKPEVWFAKIVQFHLDNKESEVVDVSNLEGATFDV